MFYGRVSRTCPTCCTRCILQQSCMRSKIKKEINYLIFSNYSRHLSRFIRIKSKWLITGAKSKVWLCLSEQTDRTDDVILQPFRTIVFFSKNVTRLAVKSMHNDIAPNTIDVIIRSLGNSLHASEKLCSLNKILC